MSQIESLLEHREWLRDLSRRLVADSNVADDLVQKTWLAAVERPPQDSTRPRAWLATVMRNWLRRGWRDDATMRRHEQAAAKPEGIAGPDEMVARAEEMRRVVDAVLRLDEPYRTTLLYRHHEGLAPRHIAERMGVPVETVRTRVKRGLAMVRHDLDDQHGNDGRTWALALLPLTNMPVFPAPPLGAPVSTVPGDGGAAGQLLEEIIVKATTKTAAMIAFLLLLLLGGGAAVLTMQGDDEGRDDLAAFDGEADEQRERVRVSDGRADGVAGAANDAAGPGDADADARQRMVRVRILGPDGQPVEGARVEFHACESMFPTVGAWESGASILGGSDAEVVGTSGKDGVLDIAVPEEGPWTMVTRAARFANGYRWQVNGTTAVERGDAERLVERLAKGHTVRGRVVRADGSPAPGVDLLADAHGGIGAAMRGTGATTDDDGAFRIDGLHAGEARILIGAAKVAWLRVPHPATLTIRLSDQVIEGTVTHASTGAPISGVTVAAAPGAGNSGQVLATTDANGRYTLPTLVDGPVWEMRISKDGLADTRPTARLETGIEFDVNGRARIDFTMAPGAILTGVVRVEGRPIADMGVAVVMRDWRLFKGVTDDEGRYVLDSLPAGSAYLTPDAFNSPYYQPGRSMSWLSDLSRGEPLGEWGVELVPGEELLRDIELMPGVTVTGTARHDDGSPVAGAVVQFGRAKSEPSSADGAFVCDGAMPMPTATGVATLGSLRGTVTIEVTEDGTDGVEVVLREPARIAGRIVDRAGDPIPGAHALALLAGGRYGQDPWAYAESAPSTAEGFELSTHSFGRVRVRAAAPGFGESDVRIVETSAGSEDAGLQFVLAPAPSIRGIVRTSDGVAVGGARVSLHPGGPDPRRMYGGDVITSGTTDAEGRFELPEVAAGLWTVTIDDASVVRWIESVTVQDDLDLDVVCERAMTISGTLRHAGGESIAGVWLIARLDGATIGEPGYHVSARPRDDGSFEIPGLPGGTYTVETFASSGGATSVGKVTVTGIAAGATGLLIELRAAGVISGIVHDADGEPMQNAKVQAHSENGDRYTPSDSTDADGAFSLGGLDAKNGPYTLYFKPPDPPRYARCEILGRHRATSMTGVPVGRTDITAQLPLGEVISGTLLGADGAPMAGAWIKGECVAGSELNPWMRTWFQGPAAQADSEGQFRLQGLPAVEFTLFAIADPRMDPNATATVLSGGERVKASASGLELRVATTGSLRGRIEDESGRPLGAARIIARPQGDSTRTARVTAKAKGDGSFELIGLVADRPYDIEIRVPDMVPFWLRGATTGGAEVRAVIAVGEAISGRIVVPDDQKAESRFMRLLHEDGEFAATALTGPEGTFEVKALIPGTYQFELQANPGKWPAEWKSIGSAVTGQTDAILRVE